MLTFLNQKFRFLLVFILFVIGISFIFFGSWTPQGERLPTGALGKIEGREVRYDDFYAAQKAIFVTHAFQTGQLLNDREENDDDFAYQTWLQLITLAAARQANIQVTDQDVLEAIQKNPFFQENEKYTPERFQKFFQYFLTPQGVTTERFQEIIRDELTMERLFKQITSTATITPAEAEDTFNRLFGKAELSEITFSLNQIKQSINPTTEELETFYKTNSANYTTPEKRKIEYVEFKLTPEQQKLPDTEKSKALSQLGEKVFEFIGNFTTTENQPKTTFTEAAKKYNLTIQTTTPFTLDQNILPQYKQPELPRIAFDLTKDTPISDYIPLENGYLVLNLLEITPSQPIPFKDAQKQVQEDYLHQKSIQLLQEQAKKFEKEIKEKLATGQTWEKAVADLKQKTSNIPPFIPAETDTLKVDSPNIVRLLGQRLAVGQVSDFIPTTTGGLILYLKNRTAPTEEKRKQVFTKIQETLLRQRKEQLIQEWFQSRLTRPKTQIPEKLLKNLER